MGADGIVGEAATELVVASSNPHKLVEISAVFDVPGFALRPQSDFGLRTPPEDGGDFVENAKIKARYACERTGLAAIAEDSGLEVDVLEGRPGIRSARYAGENASDAANLKLLLEHIWSFRETQLTARFRCAAIYAEPEARSLWFEATWEGRLLKSPRGSNGFGYDPIFFVAEYGCTAADLSPATKNRISHRARAFAGLRKMLQTHLSV